MYPIATSSFSSSIGKCLSARWYHNGLLYSYCLSAIDKFSISLMGAFRWYPSFRFILILLNKSREHSYLFGLSAGAAGRLLNWFWNTGTTLNHPGCFIRLCAINGRSSCFNATYLFEMFYEFVARWLTSVGSFNLDCKEHFCISVLQSFWFLQVLQSHRLVPINPLSARKDVRDTKSVSRWLAITVISETLSFAVGSSIPNSLHFL